MKAIAILLVGPHNHNQIKKYFPLSFVFIMLSLSACSEHNNRDFVITDCGKDTTIIMRDLIGQYAVRLVSLKVSGNINEPATLLLEENVGKIGTFSSVIHFNLEKGKVNLQGKQEIYAQDYRIVYLHSNASKGQLKVRLQLLNPSGDTLADK